MAGQEAEMIMNLLTIEHLTKSVLPIRLSSFDDTSFSNEGDKSA